MYEGEQREVIFGRRSHSLSSSFAIQNESQENKGQTEEKETKDEYKGTGTGTGRGRRRYHFVILLFSLARSQTRSQTALVCIQAEPFIVRWQVKIKLLPTNLLHLLTGTCCFLKLQSL
ncbi:uncharacterized protein LOC143889631 isoform X1 [Tasmannia lanceolata]|uniref:uncharacterized protein LOC143889631 isoform X1 n=1 Tax=Tasmannia lanceolata TaxID=3420 RepID=UPI004062E6A1